jgi:hypothetical protein
MNTIPSVGGVGFTHSKFIVCKLEQRGDRTEKMPCNAQGIVTSLHTADRMTLEQAQQTASGLGANYRAGVIIDGDGRWCLDIDGALQADNSWSGLASELCATFAGCYVEVSQSGKGLHIFGYSASIPPHASKNVPLHIELYSDNRFICLGQCGQGDMFFNAAAPLNAVVSRYFPAQEQTTAAEWTTTHVPQSCPIVDDEKLIAKACAATSAAGVFGARGTFKDLWHGNTDAYDGDASSADAALAQHLAFWTGNNCERIESLMRKSALKRDKWDNHKSYMQRTILGAVSRQTNWYSVGAPIETVSQERIVEAAEPVVRSGFQFIGGTQLVDMFRGCVYIAKYHSILAPNGMMYKSEQFNTLWGGYTFTLDESNEKTTRKAWEAFTESQLYTFSKVEDITYDPDTPFGSITQEDEVKYVNAFKPTTDTGIEGDVSVFINHVKKLCPLDHHILLDWMAWKVQNPGECMRWAPVIVGAPGNGKTTIADAMMLVMGKRHSTVVQSSDVDNKFNGWVHGNTFAVINDFKVGDKRDVIEILKPIITDRTIPFQKKGVETDTCRNMLGIIITSNHRDAVIKTKDDRRYATFITPHESADDILRDGMDETYYAALDHFMRNPLSASYMRYYFHARQVAHHPNRAPETSSTALAITASLGTVEQEVLEAIEEGRQGFMGGWVSSKALDNLLKQMRAERQVPPARRRDMMRSLGYDWHPGLKDGRVNNVIMIDGGKPRLYIKLGHIHANLQGAAEIARHYQQAQGDMSMGLQMQG